MAGENGDRGPHYAVWGEDEQPIPLGVLTATEAEEVELGGALPPADVERTRRPSAAAITAERMLRTPAESPPSGWRRAAFRLSGGRVRVGPPAAELQKRELRARVKT